MIYKREDILTVIAKKPDTHKYHRRFVLVTTKNNKGPFKSLTATIGAQLRSKGYNV